MQSINKFCEKDRFWEMNNGGFLYIERPVLDVIERYRQYLPSDNESGGFLVGYYKNLHLHITGLTVPQPKDKSGRFHFHRRDLSHVEQVTKWYKESDGLINCLGEWHTHPESNPKPSHIDIKGWKTFIKNRTLQETIFMIAGTHGFWAGNCFGSKL